MSRLNPSWKTGFAQYPDQAQYPGLHKGRIGHWATILGPTYDVVPNLADKSADGTIVTGASAPDLDVEAGYHRLKYDGTDDHVSIPNANYTGRNAGSLVMWVLSSLTQRTTIFGMGASVNPTLNYSTMEFGASSTGSYANESLGFIVRNNVTFELEAYVRNGESFYNDGLWHCFIYTSGDGNAFYVDGVQQAVTYGVGSSATNTLSTSLNPDYFYLGRKWTAAPQYQVHSLAEFIFYDRPLDAREAELISRRPGIALETRQRKVYGGAPVTPVVYTSRGMLMGVG